MSSACSTTTATASSSSDCDRLTTAALLSASRDGVVDEHPAHRLCRDGQEVRPVLPLDAGELGKLEPRLVDQRRGAEGVIGAFTAHRPGSNAPQLVVHERKQIFHTSSRKILNLRSQDASTVRHHVGLPAHVNSNSAVGRRHEPRRHFRRKPMLAP